MIYILLIVVSFLVGYIACIVTLTCLDSEYKIYECPLCKQKNYLPKSHGWNHNHDCESERCVTVIQRNHRIEHLEKTPSGS